MEEVSRLLVVISLLATEAEDALQSPATNESASVEKCEFLVAVAESFTSTCQGVITHRQWNGNEECDALPVR